MNHAFGARDQREYKCPLLSPVTRVARIRQVEERLNGLVKWFD
jgi:hypothetical protein